MHITCDLNLSVAQLRVAASDRRAVMPASIAAPFREPAQPRQTVWLRAFREAIVLTQLSTELMQGDGIPHSGVSEGLGTRFSRSAGGTLRRD